MFVLRSIRIVLACAVVLAAVLAAGLASSSRIPSKVDYQGRLVNAGGEALPGEHTVVFRIFDADAGGTELWSETQPIVADASGVFAAIIGSVDSIDAGFDGARWLEVEVDGEILAPRREMVSVPYAFQAANAHMVAGLTADAFADSAHVHHSLDAADGDPAGAVFIDNDGNVGVGTQTPAVRLDVAGTAEVDGFSMSAGAAEGHVLTSDATGTGTWQAPQAAPDGDWAISGDDMYSAVPGKVGIGTAAPVYKFQVEDDSGADGSAAMFGANTSTSGRSTKGVYGQTRTLDPTYPGVGVQGSAVGAGGSSWGVMGLAEGASGVGVAAFATNATGSNKAVYAVTSSPSGYAGYFMGGRNYFEGRVGIGTPGPFYPLQVENYASAGQPIAIVGECQSAAAVTPIGVWGLVGSNSVDSPGQGVYGKAYGTNGSSSGVRGQADGAMGRGVWGHATNTSGTNFGVYGETASFSGYAGYFVGGRNYFDGNVGIGVTSPTQKLHVGVPASGMLWYTLKLDNSGTANGTATGILFKVDTSVEPGPERGKGGIVYEKTDTYNRGDFHILQDSGANTDVASLDDAVVTIKNNGNVGIGTRNPGYPLCVTSKSLPDSAVAIVGFHDSFAGRACGGVWGQTNTADGQYPGFGVRGTAGANHGTGRGVIGEAYADSGVAVYAMAEHHTGVNFGIQAYTNSPSGYAGYFGGRTYFSGNVGIGTWAPLRKLHVYENANGILSYPIKVENYGNLSGTATGILFKVDGGAEDRGKGAIVYERTDTWNRGDFHILQRTDVENTGAATLDHAVVTIKNNGNVGIGTKTPGYKLQVGAAGDGSQARANAWNLLSSREYKRDIEPLDPAQCRRILEEAAATDVVRYRFADDPSGVRHLGVIAEESPPDIVASDGKGVSLGDYSAFLLAAIKAQQAEIEALKAQVEELESRVGNR